MTYTEVKRRGSKTYYYRVRSVRDGKKVSKKRKYLGADLTGSRLRRAEREADAELGMLESLLTADEIRRLTGIRKRYASLPKATLENRYETFVTRFTHDSTAIEGNTLTLLETGSLLFDEMVPAGRSLREVNEVLNHRKAFDLLLGHRGGITRKFIFDLHRLVIKETLAPGIESQTGRYRTVQVYIRGLDWMPPAPKDVPNDMRTLLTWYAKNRDLKGVHPLVVASYFHVGFEIVHPFVDGNGRVGRLLMNFILHRKGFPMVNIPNADRYRYYEALEKAQTKGQLRPFVELLLGLMEGGEILL